MTGMLNVNHGSLSAAAEGLKNTAKRIEADLDQLEGDLGPLKSDWTGSAKAAYDQARQQWNQAMNEMFVLLASVGSGVEQSNQEYRAADSRGASRFGG